MTKTWKKLNPLLKDYVQVSRKEVLLVLNLTNVRKIFKWKALVGLHLVNMIRNFLFAAMSNPSVILKPMSGLVHKLGLDFSKFSEKFREINCVNWVWVCYFSSRCIPKNYCKPYVDNERFEFEGIYLISREKLLISLKKDSYFQQAGTRKSVIYSTAEF